MSIEDDVVLLERVPDAALVWGATPLAHVGDRLRAPAEHPARRSSVQAGATDAESGFVVQTRCFPDRRLAPDAETTVGPGTLIGELALVVPMKRPANATALEYSSVIRIAREPVSARAGKRSRRGGPAARDEFAVRSSQIAQRQS